MQPVTPSRLPTPASVAGHDDLDRRGFLRTATGGTLAIAFASILPAGCSADYPQAADDGVTPTTLSAKEYAVLRAAAEAILEGVPVTPASVATAIDDELARVGEPIQSDIRNVLRLIEHLTILGFHRRTFTELEPAERLAYLDGWARSRLALRRGAYQALRGFVQYFAYIQPVTRSLTGFEGPLGERVVIPPVREVDYGEVV